MFSNKDILKNFPHLYYINLDRQSARKERFEQQCYETAITNVTRIVGFDGKDSDLSEYISGSYPKDLSPSEVGCTLSHLNLLNHFIYETDHDRILVCEDDVSFEMIKHWKFTWDFFETHLPYDWDVVQLIVNNPVCMHLDLHVRFINDFSTACYMMRRKYAEKLLNLHGDGKKFKIDQHIKPRAVADALLYNAGKAYAIPLFTTEIGTEGAINEEFYSLQKSSNQFVTDFWKEKTSINMEDYRFLWDYNPFISQLPPEVYRRGY